MYSTADLAKELGVANSTAVLWCDMYDRFAAKSIERIGKNGVRKLSSHQIGLLKLCHSFSKATGEVNSLEISVRTVLGNEEYLRPEYQDLFDAQIRAQKNPVVVLPQQPIAALEPVNHGSRADMARSRGTVTQISRVDPRFEAMSDFEETLERISNQNNQQIRLMQQTMLDFAERIDHMVTAKNELPAPRIGEENRELKVKVERAMLNLKYKLAERRTKALVWEETKVGRLYKFALDWALPIALICAMLLFCILLTICATFIFTWLMQK